MLVKRIAESSKTVRLWAHGPSCYSQQFICLFLVNWNVLHTLFQLTHWGVIKVKTCPSFTIIRGAFGNFLAGTLTPQCVNKMLLNNTFLKIRIQLDGLFCVENRLGVHVQRMLKISIIYTLAEILSKIFVKKRRIIESWFDKQTIWYHLIFY